MAEPEEENSGEKRLAAAEAKLGELAARLEKAVNDFAAIAELARKTAKMWGVK
jgi:nitrate reductase assembly molybdenum cofactor insertion protein NarJ